MDRTEAGPKRLALELSGVIADVEQGQGFDAVCLDTLKRVRSQLFELGSASEPAQDIYVECRECVDCNHVGINDAHETDAACSECEWSGPSPKEDRCPSCKKEGTMSAACPKCSNYYRLLASRNTSTNSSEPAQTEAFRFACAAGPLGDLAVEMPHFSASSMHGLMGACHPGPDVLAAQATADAQEDEHSGILDLLGKCECPQCRPSPAASSEQARAEPVGYAELMSLQDLRVGRCSAINLVAKDDAGPGDIPLYLAPPVPVVRMLTWQVIRDVADTDELSGDAIDRFGLELLRHAADTWGLQIEPTGPAKGTK